MSLVDSPQVLLWQAVILQAVRDAEADNKHQQNGTEKIYKWSKEADCKEVCYYAQLNHDAVRVGFIKIYLKFLDNKKIEVKKLFLKDKITEERLDRELAEIEEKEIEVYNRWDEIRWQKR